ncbi:MAG: 5'-nucleotidase C-terminal domain-containing protein [Bdellovibrionaceae bacterium]|nr:5'-nucleotidase C-terminal domain-containing protein [Pseudobdellovibrionaceae bacterium]
MKSRFAWVVVSFFILITGGCVSNQPMGHIPERALANPVPITFLHTNDTHGHAWPHKDRDGVLRGGFAAQNQVVDAVWREVDTAGGVTFVLSAGDINTGVPESDLLDSEPDIMAMNRIGYDAMVLGNHEFDKGVEKIRKQQGWAKFPFLSANVLTKDGNYLTRPYVIIDRGIKVGILGLTTGDLKVLVSPEFTKGLVVEDPITAAKKHIPQMKAEGADLIVALTHIGLIDKKANSLFDKFIDDRKLAEAVPEIQLIVGGHTDVLLEKGLKVGNTLIAQAGSHGDHLGRVDLLFDTSSGRLVNATATVLPVLPDKGEEKELAKLMNEYKERGSATLEETVATATSKLDGERQNVRNGETNLGNLLTDALRETTGTEIAIYNGGGIRDSIEAGKIKVRDVYQVLPFSNTVVTATITGKQLKTALESGLKNRHLTGSFLQVSGISFEAVGDRVTDLKIGGKAVVPSKKYSVSTNNFILAGGDHFEILTKLANKKDTALPVERVLIDYLKAKKEVDPKVEKRIRLSTEKHLSGGKKAASQKS